MHHKNFLAKNLLYNRYTAGSVPEIFKEGYYFIGKKKGAEAPSILT